MQYGKPVQHALPSTPFLSVFQNSKTWLCDLHCWLLRLRYSCSTYSHYQLTVPNVFLQHIFSWSANSSTKLASIFLQHIYSHDQLTVRQTVQQKWLMYFCSAYSHDHLMVQQNWCVNAQENMITRPQGQVAVAFWRAYAHCQRLENQMPWFLCGWELHLGNSGLRHLLQSCGVHIS